MKGRKPEQNAVRRGGHSPAEPQAVELVAEVVTPGVRKPDSVKLNPIMSQCWDDYLGQAPGFEECDVPLLESYCYWYAVLQNAMNSTMTLDGRIATTVSEVDDDGAAVPGTAKAHPDLRTAEKATTMLRQLGDALNISPTARVRSGLMRAMTVSTQAELVARTRAGLDEFRKNRGALDAPK